MKTNNPRLDLLLRKNSGREYQNKFESEVMSLLKNSSYEVLSLEETDYIINQVKNVNFLDKRKIKKSLIPFENKKELLEIINQIKTKDNQSVYLNLGYSQYCGLVCLKNIGDFNYDFDFHAEHTGLIVLYDYSLSNKLILDFYIENKNKFLDIEVFGDNWG